MDFSHSFKEKSTSVPLLKDGLLLGQTVNQQMVQVNEDTLPLKTAKFNTVLFNSISSGQTPTGNIETMNGSFQEIGQINNYFSKIKYLENTFSQVAEETNTGIENVSKTRNSSIRPLVWNGEGSLIFQQMSKPEQLILMTQGTKKNTSVNNLIQQFETILSKSKFSKIDGTQKLLINLRPENLGSLRIELIQKDQTTVARILTTTEAAKDALEANLHNLKETFAAQNIPVHKIEIGNQLSQSQQTRFSNNEQQHQQRSNQNSQEQRKENEKDNEKDSFILSLDEALLNQKV